MDYRIIALRVLLASLCIAALSGLSVLFIPSANSLIFRLIGTAIVTAIASSLLLFSIKGVESKTYHIVGSTAGALVCIVYICSTAAIWTDMLRSSSLAEHLLLTALATAGCGIAILTGTACMAHKRLEIAGKVFTGLWVLVLCAWLAMIWVFNARQYSDSFLFVLVPLQIYSGVFAFVLIHRLIGFRVAGLSIALCSCLAVQIGMLSTGGAVGNEPLFLNVALIAGWIGALMAVWTIISFRNPNYAMPWCERVTAILVAIALASFCGLIWYSELSDHVPEILVRMSIAFGILAPTALIALVIGSKVRTNAFLHTSDIPLIGSCPRCQKHRTFLQGKSVCTYCGHATNVKMECAGCRYCRYDLTGCVESGVCPECGTIILLESAVE